MAQFSHSVIVRCRTCHKIPWYGNRVLAHRDRTQRAALKIASVWDSPKTYVNSRSQKDGISIAFFCDAYLISKQECISRKNIGPAADIMGITLEYSWDNLIYS